MNNHHLFLIRSDSVTQICAHLGAGILALLFVFSLTGSPKQVHLPEAEANVPQAEAPAALSLTEAALPAAGMLLASK